MKKSDVEIGMKVVPIRKSTCLLSESTEWKWAKEKGQKFLYVIGWREEPQRWSLSVNKTSSSGDWFKSFEFKPYTGE